MKLFFLFLLLLPFSCAPAQAAPDYEKLCDAVFLAEGGVKAKKPFGVLSVPCSGYQDCRAVCLRSAANNWRRWNETDKRKTYLEFFRDRWAPIGANNDPQGLNANFLKNVLALLKK